MLEVPTWAQSSIVIFATDEHIWQISATKVWNREEPPLFCSALPDSQLCSAFNTRALRLLALQSSLLDELQLLCRLCQCFRRTKPESNCGDLKWMEGARKKASNSSGSSLRGRDKNAIVVMAAIKSWIEKQNNACGLWSTNQKLTFLYLKVVVTLHLHWSLIETTGTKGERRWRRIFVRFEGSGCLLAACLHSCPALLLLLLPSTNATL